MDTVTHTVLPAVATAVLFAPLAAALFCLVTAVAGRPMGLVHLVVLGVLEAGLLTLVVLQIVRLAGGDRPADGLATFVLYLAGSPFVLPVAAVWGLVDRSRWGSAVLVVACLVVPVLVVRMNQVWAGA